MADDRRGGGDRTRDRRDRDDFRDSRNGGRDRANAPEGRNRSRSPRRDREDRHGGYRNRSPPGRGGDRGRARRGRGGRDGDRGGGDRRHDHDRDSRDPRSNREPPKGPRGAPSGPRRDFDSGGAPKPPVDPRAAASPEVDEDVKMDEQPQRQRPEGMDDDTWEMAQVMGFARFKSTKNTKVPGNDKNYGVRNEKKMEARQYMNRQGGFNRPLSPSHG
ncbi:hypothetical protein P171DRAFT_522150 [Karstenula rhodostoma CBS 690.94]|uniref:U4/U6.U5 small nuclear ribonucleoprotein 27kDa protein domain-containing protein n=1 Tax=Karstenula rhodostoma CBS 690.94 TaxID=1392251 RepID=A0A9P4UAV3_9PLEO|nr:hypothetical protein P171DRAFT_522150 [Karstenula rhodostoma CBS 690.94]